MIGETAGCPPIVQCEDGAGANRAGADVRSLPIGCQSHVGSHCRYLQDRSLGPRTRPRVMRTRGRYAAWVGRGASSRHCAARRQCRASASTAAAKFPSPSVPPKPTPASFSTAPSSTDGRDRDDPGELSATSAPPICAPPSALPARASPPSSISWPRSAPLRSTTPSSRSTARKCRSWTAAPAPSSTRSTGRRRRARCAGPLPQGAAAGARRDRPVVRRVHAPQRPPHRGRDRFRQSAHRPPALRRRHRLGELPPRYRPRPHLRLPRPMSRRCGRSGFARGASLENAVVIGEDRVINPEGLRFADEFVRHKVLDAVGDLALAGMPILGCYRSYRGGHRLNVKARRSADRRRPARGPSSRDRRAARSAHAGVARAWPLPPTAPTRPEPSAGPRRSRKRPAPVSPQIRANALPPELPESAGFG